MVHGTTYVSPGEPPPKKYIIIINNNGQVKEEKKNRKTKDVTHVLDDPGGLRAVVGADPTGLWAM